MTSRDKHVNQIAHFGLLATNEDQTVKRAKPAYRAMQHITAIFDDTITRIPDYPWCTLQRSSADPYSVFGYRGSTGMQLVTIWRDNVAPSVRDEFHLIALAFPAGDFEQPVYVDVLNGDVHEIPATHRGGAHRGAYDDGRRARGLRRDNQSTSGWRYVACA